jgi:hypothetical protein
MPDRTKRLLLEAFEETHTVYNTEGDWENYKLLNSSKNKPIQVEVPGRQFFKL